MIFIRIRRHNRLQLRRLVLCCGCGEQLTKNMQPHRERGADLSAYSREFRQIGAAFQSV
jgi:hypothetical protein